MKTIWHPGDEMPETGTVAVLAYRAAQGGIVYDGEIYLFPGTFTYVLGEWALNDPSFMVNPRSKAYAEFWWYPEETLLDQLRDQIGKTI